jgi:2',3'-cyclic-nucleotide 2'-phosphodiesterase (5'-nucleotidase family)
VVALTHQPLPDDRHLADAGLVDLVLGGHEHEGYTEVDHLAPLIKAPMNAVAAVVADLHIHGPGRVDVSVRLEPVAGWSPDPSMAARVEGHLAAVRALEAQVLLRLEPGRVLSSRDARSAQTSLGALVCSRLRDTLEADAAVLNGGALRGDGDHQDAFTFADLRTELPFQTEAVVVDLPGTVFAEAVHFARTERAGTGGFLQLDDRSEADPRHHLTQVAGAPFDPARTYRVALPRELLVGIDRLEPLLVWARAHPEQVPAATTGIHLKVALLRTFGA